MQDIPDPIASWDLTDPERVAASYESCIKAIIGTMAKGTDKKFNFQRNGEQVCSVPVTPGVDETPARPYVVELKCHETRLLLVAEKY